MNRTVVEEGFRIVLPETLRGYLHVGDEVVVERDSNGRIVIASIDGDPDVIYPLSDDESLLGRQLREIRERIVLSGAPLLDWDALELEIAERRREH